MKQIAEKSGVQSQPRIEIVDALRGFALFGILFINITAFYAPGGPPGFAMSGDLFDRIVVYFLIVFVESKFFTLFSFLFGIGFSIQMARSGNQNFTKKFIRRLLVLGLFGIAHIVLLWEGDILLLYSLIGFPLLLFRRATPRNFVRLILALLIVPSILVVTVFSAIETARVIPAYSAQISQAETSLLEQFVESRRQAADDLSGGSYLKLLTERITEYQVTFLLLLSRAPIVLAMFLLGMRIGQKGYLTDVDAHQQMLKKVRFWGLSVGSALSLAVIFGYIVFQPLSALTFLFFNQTLAGPILSMGYAATFVLAAQSSHWQPIVKLLSFVGRMSLTNYLLQSLINALLFSGYGLGLAGKIKPLTGILLSAIIFVAQILLSKIWLAFFRFGPAEWFWRSATYLKPQPFFRSTTDSAFG